MSVPVTSLDNECRPVVTLTVKPNDASSISHKLVCLIDTGSDPALIFRSYRQARELGLAVNDAAILKVGHLPRIIRFFDF